MPGPDLTYGARFMAELRRRGATAGNWNYKTVTAIEAADRERFVEVWKQIAPRIPNEVLELALTEEPEALARKLVEDQRDDSVLGYLFLSS